MTSNNDNTRRNKSDQVDEDMARADQANGERPPDDTANDTEAREGKGGSPA
jgi:hypothetical protein